MEHHRAIPRLVLTDYACSPFLFIKELAVENKPGHTPRLISMHAVINPSFISQIYERMEDLDTSHRKHTARFFITKDNTFATLSLCGNYALDIRWMLKTPAPSDLTFEISAITVYGIPPRDPYDLACDLLAESASTFSLDAPNAVHAKFSPENATFSLNLTAWIFNALECSRIDCTHGQLSLQLHQNSLRLRFERQSCPQPKSEPHKIQITTFLQDIPEPQALSSELSLEYTPSSCPEIEHLHKLAHACQPISEEILLKAIQLAKAERSPSEFQALLYFIYQWVPSAANIVRMYLLTDDMGTTAHSPLAFDILKAIYLDQNDEDMLLALIQQRAHECSHAPHMRMQLRLEAAKMLAQRFQRFDSAAAILDALKPIIQTIATPDEKIAFAEAYSLAQYHNTAIQYLRLWMNQAKDAQQTAKYGVALARTMFDHNDPLQSIINVCRKVLDVDPQNLETLSLLALCLENSDNFEEAVDAYLACFELLIFNWKQAKTLAELSPSDNHTQALEQAHINAIKAAQALENVIEKLPDYPAYNRILELHQQLDPADMAILSRRLKFLAMRHAFPEMAQACLDFLRVNQDNLKPEDALTLHLTLHDLYDCEFAQPDEALKHLKAAQDISECDPRVLLTQIERCKRHNQASEQIPLMLTLIDVLPHNEAAAQTLELVKLLESLNEPSEKILDILRKINTRYPNQPQILLELRQYLRRCGQPYELAIVLEKLARATKDLQARKNLLLEASETNEKLGNTQLAQALYHEAQLCSPINPDKFDFIPDNIKPGFTARAQSKLDPASSLTSNLLSSRSISIANIPIISNTSNTHSYTQISASEVSVSAEIISSSSSAAIVTTAFPDEAPPASSDDANSISPLQDMIVQDRLKGDTDALLTHLLQSIQDIPETEQPPRVLQEIGSIYLYERHDPKTARDYLERASALSPEVANGELTLNALEAIYQSLKCFRELADIYQKKCKILTISDECKKYAFRLAQLRYEYLGETDLAIETLKNIIQKAPDNEKAMRLLAQIYIDTRDFDHAIQTLNDITRFYVPGSKQMAQLQLRLIKLHIDTGQIDTAKTEIHKLIDSNDFIDKLALIEIYKHICRERDEWTELLDILIIEIAYLLKVPHSELKDKLDKHLHDSNISAASNALREYADILYHKCDRIAEAVTIYRALINILPEHQYPKNMLKEIYEQHPEFNTSDSDS